MNVDRDMSPRLMLIFGMAATGLVIASLCGVLMFGRSLPKTASTEVPSFERLANPPGMVDRLVMIDRLESWAAGALERTRLVSVPSPRIVLEDLRETSFPREGRWTSAEVASDFPFTELVPSWNADVPADSGVTIEVRVRGHADRGWSPWLSVGSWGRPLTGSRTISFPFGKIDIDHLRLSREADAFQMRVNFASFSLAPSAVPALRRLTVSYSGVVGDPALRARWTEAVPPGTRWQRLLPVPFRTQQDTPKRLSWQICSPTSVSMVLQYFGIDHSTNENALAIYDTDNDLFGNWGRAVQYAATQGLDAWLTRFRNWDQVKAQISLDCPVIASIRFEKGEFPSALLKSSNGHLLVIRGFTPDGDVICNDPAKSNGNGVVYKATELAHAWFDHGGVGYVIHGKSPATQPATPAHAR